MDRRKIVVTVNQFMIDKLEVETVKLSAEAELRRDLGLTSLDAIELVLFMKRTYNIERNENDLKEIVTMGDLYDYIEQHQNNCLSTIDDKKLS